MIGLILVIFALFFYYNKAYITSLVIFFMLVTNGYQLIPIRLIMNGLPIEKGSDLGLIFLLFIFFSKLQSSIKTFKKFKLFRYIVYLILFVFFDGLYSVIILNYSIVNVLQVFRPYLFLLGFVIFVNVPLRSLMNILNILTILTVFQSSLYLIQILLNQTILLSIAGNEKVTTTILADSGYVRFYNTPIFLIPTLFYYLFLYKFSNNTLRIFVLSILFLTVLGPAHRSAIISVAFVIFIYYVLRQSFGNRLLYIISSIVVYGLLTFVDIFNKRINQAYNDLLLLFSSNLNLKTINAFENTSIYRVAHFLERFYYVINEPFGWLFGIGLISDNSIDVKKLHFKFGLVSEVTGKIVQVDTGDLIWSPLILTLGFIGAFFYVYIFFKILLFFYKNIQINYSVVAFLTLLYSFLTSFAGTMMLDLNFRLIIIFFIVLIYKKKIEDHVQENVY